MTMTAVLKTFVAAIGDGWIDLQEADDMAKEMSRLREKASPGEEEALSAEEKEAYLKVRHRIVDNLCGSLSSFTIDPAVFESKDPDIRKLFYKMDSTDCRLFLLSPDTIDSIPTINAAHPIEHSGTWDKDLANLHKAASLSSPKGPNLSGLSEDQAIQAVLDWNNDSLNKLYERVVLQKATAELRAGGSIDIRLTLAKEGTVKKADIKPSKKNGLKDADMLNGIKEIFEKMEFPPLKNERVIATTHSFGFASSQISF
jgi:hypothetical protein